ncbi:MAG: molybdenum cofactor guanylyltransferase [Desulfobulbaceae bacterium]|nr:molybdenum cofactor guanylyltransferase [Desulfobulbaceae bacterium]
MIDAITGVVLAGGASTRFGSNKALAVHDGQPLIAHVVATMENLFSSRLLVTNTPETYGFLGWPSVGDHFRGAGPLAGIHAALGAIKTPYAFVVGCDMPFVSERLVRVLADLANGDWDAVVPCPGGRPEPLYAMYHRRCLATIEANLQRDERKIGFALQSLRVRRVEEKELLAVLPDLGTFLNVNRPVDLPGR